MCQNVPVAPAPPTSTGEIDGIGELATRLKALSDPVRLQLINALASRAEVCACDFPALVQRSQPTVSHHLTVLVKAGLVHREQRGKWAWFALCRPVFGELSDLFAIQAATAAPTADKDCCG